MISSELSVFEDWSFRLEDLRDASGDPIDMTGYDLKLRFCPASLSGFTIDEVSLSAGITYTAGEEGMGPTIELLSRACNRTWRPLIDTPVVGDLMMYRGTTPSRDSVLVQRISFVATWGSTRDG